ncbi:hypothetical protein [Halomonas sp. M4R1S46]|uniref:hypothetical protein n=1 Tax=Halomonas sp. M4R1S46 TaxID=2982692 RepID=UPI0021E3EE92|nr:hypothetical protein [Halomonas sp. M4R1S46]UYG08298.1 hypothetical protein OCT48_02850 [Halomonas sp. M4R1S46]
MLKKIFFILPIALLVSACQEGVSNDIHDDSVELQRQANEEVAFGIAEGNSDRLDRAKDLIEQSLQADPSNHEALLNRAQIAVYQQNYKLALRDVESAYDIALSNDSLPLFRCMLIEEVEGDDTGKECYSAVEESYAEQHSKDSQIPANWVGAAILADSQAAPELVEAYLEQERAEGEMEAEMAKMTIESLQDGSYVDQVLMR